MEEKDFYKSQFDNLRHLLNQVRSYYINPADMTEAEIIKAILVYEPNPRSVTFVD